MPRKNPETPEQRQRRLEYCRKWYQKHRDEILANAKEKNAKKKTKNSQDIYGGYKSLRNEEMSHKVGEFKINFN